MNKRQDSGPAVFMIVMVSGETLGWTFALKAIVPPEETAGIPWASSLLNGFACLGQLPSGTLLDGELVVLQGGKPSLAEIQRRALLQNSSRIKHLSRIRPVSYMVFDLPFLKGRPLMAAALSLRREALIDLYNQFPLPGILLSEGLRADDDSHQNSNDFSGSILLRALAAHTKSILFSSA